MVQSSAPVTHAVCYGVQPSITGTAPAPLYHPCEDILKKTL